MDETLSIYDAARERAAMDAVMSRFGLVENQRDESYWMQRITSVLSDYTPQSIKAKIRHLVDCCNDVREMLWIEELQNLGRLEVIVGKPLLPASQPLISKN